MIRKLFVSVVLVVALWQPALAQFIAPQSIDPQTVGPGGPQMLNNNNSVQQPTRQAPIFGAPRRSVPTFGPGLTIQTPQTSTFEIVNQFGFTVYFYVGTANGRPRQVSLDGFESRTFRHPMNAPVYAAIDTQGQFQAFEMYPGATYYVSAYNGWYVMVSD